MSIFFRSALLTILVAAAPIFAWKDIAHFVSLPLIEGSGIYCAVNILNKANAPVTKVAAVTDLTCLGVNAGLGMVTMFGSVDMSPKLRKMHRAVGYATTVAAIFMAVTSGLDNGIGKNPKTDPVKYVSYGHAALTTVPLIIFAF